MSAPLAGKFVDHYLVLGVDPGADTDAIQIAYMKLYEKYGADNIDTADAEKLDAIQAAYETLSDPELRKEFDAIKGVSRDSGRPMFMGMEFFDVLGREVGLRGALLSVLYDRRRSKPFTPALSMRQLESILDASVEAMNFSLWYLKQRGFVGSDDKSSLQITVAGMDFLENNRPKPEDVMPFIKLSAIMGAAPPEAPQEETPQQQETEPQAEELEPPAAAAAHLEEPVAPRAPLPKLDGASIRSMLNRAQPTR
jgi:curved DNA-binding protein CbpA